MAAYRVVSHKRGEAWAVYVQLMHAGTATDRLPALAPSPRHALNNHIQTSSSAWPRHILSIKKIFAIGECIVFDTMHVM